MKPQPIITAVIATALGLSACGTLTYRDAREITFDTRLNASAGDKSFRQIIQSRPTVTASAPVYGGIEPHPTWRNPGDPGYVGEGHWLTEE